MNLKRPSEKNDRKKTGDPTEKRLIERDAEGRRERGPLFTRSFLEEREKLYERKEESWEQTLSFITRLGRGKKACYTQS